LGVALVAPAAALGLALEALLPGLGVQLASVICLSTFLFVAFGHTALACARACCAAAVWAARLARALGLAARQALGRAVALRRLAARRRARPSPSRLAAGVNLTPRLLPIPRAAAA
jgi:hypothetical protein